MGRNRTARMDDLVDGLRRFEGDVITLDHITEFCSELRIADADLNRYTSYRDDRYTRNLVYRDELFEVMVICWKPGQRTPVHSHNGQLGWLLVERGQVQVDNFHYLSCSSPGNQNVVGLDCLSGGQDVKLEPRDSRLVDAGGPVGTVDKIQTIHRMECPIDSGEPAVTVHIYSRPFASCVSYDLEKSSCFRRNLFWDTEHGQPVA